VKQWLIDNFPPFAWFICWKNGHAYNILPSGYYNCQRCGAFGHVDKEDLEDLLP
jgi:hypothetical protein